MTTRPALSLAALSVIAALMLVALAGAAEPKKDDKLAEAVRASREAKKKGRKSSGKVITDADVRKAKGKLIELPAKDEPAAEPDLTSPTQRHEAALKVRKEAEALVVSSTEKVTALEKELYTVEQAYFDENEPTYRDDVIRKRFAETKGRLAKAMEELSAAEAALQGLNTTP